MSSRDVDANLEYTLTTKPTPRSPQAASPLPESVKEEVEEDILEDEIGVDPVIDEEEEDYSQFDESKVLKNDPTTSFK